MPNASEIRAEKEYQGVFKEEIPAEIECGCGG